MIRAELLTTGTELLLGSVLNTHVRFIAEEIFPLGMRLSRQVTVPDGAAIGEAMRESFSRCDILFVTGGLGPTSDDITRDLAAELFGVTMREDPAIIESITERFARRGFTMNASIARQAMVPEGAEILPNNNGTAPGLYFPPRKWNGHDAKSPHLFLLPGPPRELHPMFTSFVLPKLMDLQEKTAGVCRTFKIVGMGESRVEALLEADLRCLAEVEIGYCARPGEVDLRLIGAVEAVDCCTPLVRERCAGALVSEDGRELAQVLIDQLVESQATFAVAESCTGGGLADAITGVPGASRVFLGGVVAYANAVKSEILGVPAQLIEAHGAVSAEVAAAMASGVREKLGADFALSTTGIAGPGGGCDEKPVGTVFIGCVSKSGGVGVERFNFPSDRHTFKHLTTQTAMLRLLNLLRDAR